MATTYRIALVAVVAISWVALVIMMWRAFHALPTAEELADARQVRPPLPTDLLLNIAQSLLIAVLLVVTLWPRWVRRYILRVAAALVLLLGWFIMSVPLDLNTMEWLHRRWLALMILLLLTTLLAYPILNRVTRRELES